MEDFHKIQTIIKNKEVKKGDHRYLDKIIDRIHNKNIKTTEARLILTHLIENVKVVKNDLPYFTFNYLSKVAIKIAVVYNMQKKEVIKNYLLIYTEDVLKLAKTRGITQKDRKQFAILALQYGISNQTPIVTKGHQDSTYILTKVFNGKPSLWKEVVDYTLLKRLFKNETKGNYMFHLHGYKLDPSFFIQIAKNKKTYKNLKFSEHTGFFHASILSHFNISTSQEFVDYIISLYKHVGNKLGIESIIQHTITEAYRDHANDILGKEKYPHNKIIEIIMLLHKHNIIILLRTYEICNLIFSKLNKNIQKEFLTLDDKQLVTINNIITDNLDKQKHSWIKPEDYMWTTSWINSGILNKENKKEIKKLIKKLI